MINTITNITNNVSDPVNKRWKLALIGSIFNIVMAIALFIIGQYQYLPVPVGCLGLIITTFIGGDSYRQSMYDPMSYNRQLPITNPNEIIGE